MMPWRMAAMMLSRSRWAPCSRRRAAAVSGAWRCSAALTARWNRWNASSESSCSRIPASMAASASRIGTCTGSLQVPRSLALAQP
nr:hypothetical protein BGP89_11215 [Luteimonas sp. JM171]